MCHRCDQEDIAAQFLNTSSIDFAFSLFANCFLFARCSPNIFICSVLAKRFFKMLAKVLVLAKNNALLAKTICYPYSVMLVVIAVGPAVSQTFHSHCSLWAHINNLFSDRFLYYLQHFSEAEDGFVWLSEDYPQFLQTRRRICI